jgi:hypothetical protein
MIDRVADEDESSKSRWRLLSFQLSLDVLGAGECNSDGEAASFGSERLCEISA